MPGLEAHTYTTEHPPAWRSRRSDPPDSSSWWRRPWRSTRARNPIVSVEGIVGTQRSGWSKADSCGRTRNAPIASPRTAAKNPDLQKYTQHLPLYINPNEPPKPTFWPMPLQPVQQYFGGVQHKRAEEAPGNDAPVRTRYGGLILLDRKEDPGEGIGLRTGVAPVVDSRAPRNSEKSLYRRNQRSNS